MTALAQDQLLPETAQTSPEPIVEIPHDEIEQAQAIFNNPVKLDVSTLEVTAPKAGIIVGDAVYSDELQLNYNVTDDAFIGVADIEDTEQVNGNKGGFPEGRYIEPVNSVAGGGIKTEF